MCTSVASYLVTVHAEAARGALRPAPAVRVHRVRDVLGRHSVALACLATLVVHLLSLSRRLGPDEGGFAMVAAHWRDPGPYLYGPQWVDRPPGLIGLFAVADHLGPYGVRLTATFLAVVLVAAVAAAAHVLGGRPAAAWAAWCAFASASSVMLESHELNGELAAATLVAVSIAVLVRALRTAGTAHRALMLGALAGGSAATALLMKQDFVDGFVFAAVLVTGAVVGRRPRSAPLAPTVGGFVGGASLVGAAALVWAAGHAGVGALVYAMYGFRQDATVVIAHWSFAAPQRRLVELIRTSLVTGLLVLLVQLAASRAGRVRRTGPLGWALTAAIGTEVFGIVAGGNFWSHYLIALIPAVSLAAGLVAARRAQGWRVTRVLVVATAALTATVAPLAALHAAHQPSAAWTTGRWVAAAAEPGDSIVVPFTHANLIQASGLRPGYPYAWSLPTRTLDPDLSLLTTTLSGPSGPTWVVRWDAPHLWGLDPGNQVDAALQAHYRLVATVCGHAVWLHDGATRPTGAPPSRHAC
jgi:hypothetical protein